MRYEIRMGINININEDYTKELEHLKNNINLINGSDDDISIKKTNLKQIYQLLNNNELKLVCRNILRNKYLENFSYKDLSNIFDILEQFYTNISIIKNKIDIEIFFEKGNLIDIQGLKKKFKELNIKKLHPNFNFKRLKELFENPPTQLLPQDGGKEYIKYDPFVVRKYLYGIIQMVINEMDLLIGYIGGEGLGKSCGCSQDINLVYYLLKELNLIEYEYKIEDMWFNSLENFIHAEDEHFDEKFRIFGLDEGNELNKQDWRDDNVRTFFQRLRRERYNQRIKFICLPQLGELITAIVVSRMNFVFNMYSRDDAKTGTIDKGFCEFFIIPRSSKIYSPAQKREISREEIKQSLSSNLDDKKKRYINQIPKSILIKKFHKNNIWGFSKTTYIKTLKETNKIFTVAKGLKLTEYQAYCYYISRPKLKDWHLDRKENPEIYSTLAKMDRTISKIFDENPDKLEKYERLMENKSRNR